VALAGTVPVASIASPSTTVSVAAMTSPSTYFVPVGESKVYRLERPIKRVAVGNPEVADFIMLNSTEFYLLGKKQGTTNLIVWDQKGNFTSTPLQVIRNFKPIKDLLKVVLPNETDIQIFASGPALVLAGSVSNTLAEETVTRLVKAYLGGTVPGVNPETTLTNRASASGSTAPASMFGAANSTSGSAAGASIPVSAAPAGIPGVVNLLKVRDPQQVRLEVRIAEVSKSLVESLGLSGSQNRGNTQGSLMTGFVSNATLDLLLKPVWDSNISAYVSKNIKVEAERKNSWIKILAEPTIVAMSGQDGYFLVGGKIYTPTITGNGAVGRTRLWCRFAIYAHRA
jgi:pilus assembly protein CpaC